MVLLALIYNYPFLNADYTAVQPVMETDTGEALSYLNFQLVAFFILGVDGKIRKWLNRFAAGLPEAAATGPGFAIFSLLHPYLTLEPAY